MRHIELQTTDSARAAAELQLKIARDGQDLPRVECHRRRFDKLIAEQVAAAGVTWKPHEERQCPPR